MITKTLLKRAWILLGLMIMVSSLNAESVIHTLEGNPSIPDEEIRGFYSSESWKMIKDAPYQGYVVIKGHVNKKNVFCPRKIEEFYPNESKNDLAFKMAGEVKISSASVGTRIDPKACVYVIFYEDDPEKKIALVFGEREQSTYFAENSLRDKYMSLFSY